MVQTFPTLTATFVKTSDWGSGFGGSWTIKNTGKSSCPGTGTGTIAGTAYAKCGSN